MGSPTFDDMAVRSPFELAAWWADRSRRLVVEPGADSHLEELAVMAALASWLGRRLPATMHRALLGGAPVEQVADAAGVNTAGVLVEWTQWAVGQRRLYDDTAHGAQPLGVSAVEYERVRNAIHNAPD